MYLLPIELDETIDYWKAVINDMFGICYLLPQVAIILLYYLNCLKTIALTGYQPYLTAEPTKTTMSSPSSSSSLEGTSPLIP